MLTGSLVAIVTPMKAGGALDLDALARLCDWHIESGTAGIVVVGTTGESPTVDVDEHCLLIKTVVEPVLVHVRARVAFGIGTAVRTEVAIGPAVQRVAVAPCAESVFARAVERLGARPYVIATAIHVA